MLERLLHHSVVLVTPGDSWRLKEARARAATRQPSSSTRGLNSPSHKEDQPKPSPSHAGWGLLLATGAARTIDVKEEGLLVPVNTFGRDDSPIL